MTRDALGNILLIGCRELVSITLSIFETFSAVKICELLQNLWIPTSIYGNIAYWNNNSLQSELNSPTCSYFSVNVLYSTKTFMMISNWIKHFGLHVLKNKFSAIRFNTSRALWSRWFLFTVYFVFILVLLFVTVHSDVNFQFICWTEHYVLVVAYICIQENI